MSPSEDAVSTVEAEVAMLLRLAERSRRSSPRRLGELDRSAYLVLGVLTTQGPRSVNAIADALRLDPSTVTRQVLAMERAGHVSRTVDDTDRRVTVVAATDEGRAALAETREIRGGIYREVLADWTEQERTALATALHRLNVDLDDWGRAHAG
ncbi:MarR family winged helix-turn-helix transcriptional regulator [Cellulomonas taurus]|jgi:DNA-binding MarR family transcriptional regulator|uniref:MarR family winged helix-turn-helix transcriptional regulator n=1 Tax=Cellulomonas taurus TaxID=2729175 RepID=UPI00145CEC6E|nr:MarR family transcriptional regulator [Cellulomonas taurus]